MVAEAITAIERLTQGQEPERSVPASTKQMAGPTRAAVNRAALKQSAAKGGVAVSYADQLMQERGILEQFPLIQRSVRQVLNELSSDAQLALRDTRLQVMVLPKSTRWHLG